MYLAVGTIFKFLIGLSIRGGWYTSKYSAMKCILALLFAAV